ncbi:MAG TPA: hypothetical protein PKI27_00880 [Dermatophilaceae bacterium]|nr:hypothetical protein [Dermatophilaceae bacterium]
MTRRVKQPASTAADSFAANREQLDAMAAVAERFSSWRPAAEVLTRVRAVPTIFPQVDAVTRVGGWPIERFALVHGPSSEGKTVFLHGLGLSFLQRGHFYNYVDAEYTTPETWVQKLMAEFATHPGFRALRPRTYEETVDAVREFCDVLGDAKAKGHLPADTSGLIVVDSLRKLVPKKLLARLIAEAAAEESDGGDKRKRKGQRGVDGLGGRAAQHKAALNAAWLDELVPMLAQTGTAMVAVARETDDPDAGMFDEGIKVGGGRAVYYDSSLVVRIVRAGWVREGDKDSRITGERHLVEVRKTKVGGKDQRRPRAAFHTSNGVLVPEGFDRPRDIIESALDYEVVTLTGSWISWGKRRLGNGLNAAVRKLHDEPALCAELESAVRAKYEVDLSSPIKPTAE